MVVGYKQITKSFPISNAKLCSICDNTSSYSLEVNYLYVHIAFILRLVVDKKYFVICDTCTGTVEIDENIAKSIIGKNPISFYDRYILLFAFFTLALVGKLMSIGII